MFLGRQRWQCTAEGHTAKEIAGVFKVAEKTIHNHRERLMRQLGIGDLTALIHYAHNLGISLRMSQSSVSSEIANNLLTFYQNHPDSIVQLGKLLIEILDYG